MLTLVDVEYQWQFPFESKTKVPLVSQINSIKMFLIAPVQLMNYQSVLDKSVKV